MKTPWLRSAGLLQRLPLAALVAVSLSGAPLAAGTNVDPDLIAKVTLDHLFAQLGTAPDAQTATQIDRYIWQIWLNPGDPALAAQMNKEQADEAAGDFPAAMVDLAAITAAFPSYAEGWNRRATVEYELGQLDASLADIDRTLALEPRHFGALSGEVMIYLAKGDRPKALKALLAALAIHPFLSEVALFPELAGPAVKT